MAPSCLLEFEVLRIVKCEMMTFQLNYGFWLPQVMQILHCAQFCTL